MRKQYFAVARTKNARLTVSLAGRPAEPSELWYCTWTINPLDRALRLRLYDKSTRWVLVRRDAPLRGITIKYKVSLRDVGGLRVEGVARKGRLCCFFNHKSMLLKVTNKA